MPTPSRRHVLHAGAAFAIPAGMVALSASAAARAAQPAQPTLPDEQGTAEVAAPMTVQYLEIVTPEVDALCEQYAAIYDITFSEPVAGFGGARTADLVGGGLLGIRAPMRATEAPVVRPYLLVDDIRAAVAAAQEAGAEVAMPPMPIPGRGTFAIVIHGGIDCGFWEI